ncbi:hypothetical protein TNCV_2372111 [Trichonephila clavipes]|nr:hypothetical protein TNCV_2372111 [Trichonephila clavipes]
MKPRGGQSFFYRFCPSLKGVLLLVLLFKVLKLIC